jgi:hypothetical protein
VGPVPDPLLLRKSGSAGNRIRTSGSVARNTDHQTTEAVGGAQANHEISKSRRVGYTAEIRSSHLPNVSRNITA